MLNKFYGYMVSLGYELWDWRYHEAEWAQVCFTFRQQTIHWTQPLDPHTTWSKKFNGYKFRHFLSCLSLTCRPWPLTRLTNPCNKIGLFSSSQALWVALNYFTLSLHSSNSRIGIVSGFWKQWEFLLPLVTLAYNCFAFYPECTGPLLTQINFNPSMDK